MDCLLSANVLSMANEYDIQSQKLARELYDAAMNGTMSFTSAWYSLPGPSPIVGKTKIADWVTYNVDYRYLSKKQASYMKQKEQEEYKRKCYIRDQELEQFRRRDHLIEEDLMGRISLTMELYEGLENYLKQAREKIDKLKTDLEQHEEGYKRTEEIFLKTKKEKEDLEQEHKKHIETCKVRHMEILNEVYKDIREHNRLRIEGMERQNMETEYYKALK